MSRSLGRCVPTTSYSITSPNSQLGINGGLSILSLIVSVTSAMLCDRVGRRPLFLAATIGMLVCFIGWTVCSALYQDSGNVGAGRAVIAFIWLFSVSYALAWSGLLVAYTVEIMPFKIRAKGLMVMNFWVQVATGDQSVRPAMLRINSGILGFILGCLESIFELVFIYIFYVETKGPTLEEIARIFDGDEAEVAQVDIAEKITRDDSMGKVGVPGEQKESPSV
ncbi:hypothetical protein B0H14DRAFT_2330992 [Mycena olivaceomarginata]|nr:hypothetical protein B0H14DRAFT_2330992 [Mycena olivaceomarginata]